MVSVIAVSDDEAWAIGSKNQPSVPFILHYTTSNGWQGDTSFSSSFPTNAQLNSIAASGPSNIWIVGDWGFYNGTTVAAFTMRYNGTAWSQIVTSPPRGSTILKGVTVIGNNVWTAGYRADNN